VALDLTDQATKITQFRAAIATNFPGTLGKWEAGCTKERVVINLVETGVSLQAIWDEGEGIWYGVVAGVRYDEATPLETMQTIAAVARGLRQADGTAADGDVTTLTDQG
jgi:hypothetical protein